LRPGHFGFDTWLSVTNYFDMNPLRIRNGEGEFIEEEPSEIIVSEALSLSKKRARIRFSPSSGMILLIFRSRRARRIAPPPTRADPR